MSTTYSQLIERLMLQHDAEESTIRALADADCPQTQATAGPSLMRPLTLPAGVITQQFGENPADYARFGLAGHNGLDYGAPLGTPVLAAHSGRVDIPAEDPPGYGRYVKVTDDATGWTTLYAHLQGITATQNEQVAAGDQIGNVGSTGNSTGPHLHFGWRVAGVANPAYAGWLDPVLGRKMHGDA